MFSDSEILPFAVVSLVCSALVCLISLRRYKWTCGLTIAYIAALQLIHLPGALVYVLPWYDGKDYLFVSLGVEQSAYGTIGFLIGSGAITPLLFRLFHLEAQEEGDSEARQFFIKFFLTAGSVAVLIFIPLFGSIPSLSAVLSTCWGLILLALCLLAWDGFKRNDKRRVHLVMFGTLSLPVFTIITQGFLGYGVGYLLLVGSFVAIFYKPRWVLFLAASVFLFLSLSFYVTYMRDRDELRTVVWGGASYTDRTEQFVGMVTDFEIFDPYNLKHLERIEGRLNQNLLVGAAVNNIELGRAEFADGETFGDAAIAIIPRAIWPDKPVVAGSGDLVTRYTGILFAEGTSIGVGQVMEFYVNFGAVGVLMGFMVLGVFVSTLDGLSKARLLSGDMMGFGKYYLLGFALINPGGSLVEISASFAATLVLVVGLTYYVENKKRVRPLAPSRQVPLTR